jgi:uncharacterized protein YjgD (DUF1641 family)
MLDAEERSEAMPRDSAAAAPGLAGYAALLGALDAALTERSVERLAEMGEGWLSVLGSPQVRELVEASLPLLPHLTRFLERLRPMLEAGLLDRLAELLTLFTAVVDAVTPLQAERLAVELEGLVTLANNVMTEDPAIVWRASLDRVLRTWEEVGVSPRPVGLGDLLRLRKDPALQRALRALLSLSQAASTGTPKGS